MGSFSWTRSSLAILNIFYIIIAIILMSVATYGKYSNRITNISVIGGIVACGVFLLFLAVLGLFATYKHHQIMLFVYMTVLFCLFIIQFSIAAACLAFSYNRQENLAKRGWLLANDKLKDNVQNYFDCCGFLNNGNVSQTSLDNPLGHPTCKKLSCCTREASDAVCCTDVSQGENNTSLGTKCPCNTCWYKLHRKMDSALKASGGIGMFFSFTELIGIYLSLKFRNMKDPYMEFSTTFK